MRIGERSLEQKTEKGTNREKVHLVEEEEEEEKKMKKKKTKQQKFVKNSH